MLRDSIRDCNAEMKNLGYDSASIIFIISRVGTNEEARKFVKGLGDDSAIGRMVYVCPSDLGSKRAVFERSKENDEYTLEVSVIFAQAAVYLSYMFRYSLIILFS
jgi:hypothetical protein